MGSASTVRSAAFSHSAVLSCCLEPQPLRCSDSEGHAVPAALLWADATEFNAATMRRWSRAAAR